MFTPPPAWQVAILAAILFAAAVPQAIGTVSPPSWALSTKLNKTSGIFFLLALAWGLLCLGHGNGYTLLGLLFS